MNLLFKAALSLVVILGATAIGRRWPSLGGLLAVMPLTGLLVLLWLYLDSKGDPATMTGYAKGALYGLIPTVLFFAVVLLGFRRALPLPLVLLLGFTAWGLAAILHQWWLR